MKGGGILSMVGESLGVMIVMGLILLATTAAGLYLVLSGWKQLRDAKKQGKPRPTGAIVRLVFGVILLLPLSMWLIQGFAYGIGRELATFVWNFFMGDE